MMKVSKKSHMPFTIDELDYDDVKWSSNYYITLVYYIDGTLKWSEFGLYNNKENNKNTREECIVELLKLFLHLIYIELLQKAA